MCYVHKEKRENKIAEEIEMPNEKRIKALQEKENQNQNRIFIVITSKQAEMEEKKEHFKSDETLCNRKSSKG